MFPVGAMYYISIDPCLGLMGRSVVASLGEGQADVI